MPLNLEHPFAAVDAALNAHIGHYTILQLGIGAGVIGLGIYAARIGIQKIFSST